jgi:hypothetical protein
MLLMNLALLLSEAKARFRLGVGVKKLWKPVWGVVGL